MAGTYKMIGVLHDGRTVEKTVHGGAPTESRLIAWGLQRRAIAVIRYFPSRKGWRILDIRKIAKGTQPIHRAGRSVEVFKGQVRGAVYYLNEDAAVMVAIHKLSGHN